jgi:hypothetical protein
MINEEKKKKLLNLKLKGPSTVDESFLGPGYESYSGYESHVMTSPWVENFKFCKMKNEY